MSALTPLLLALAAALLWGWGDWLGGRLSRHRPASDVLALSQIASLAALLLAVVVSAAGSSTLLGGLGFRLGSTDLLWAAVAGVGHALAVGALYWALARGAAAFVAPVSAVIAAVLPVSVGLLRAGIPPLLVSASLLAAVFATFLLAGPARTRPSSQVVWGTLVAGLGFAVQPIALGSVDEAGLGVVVVSELASGLAILCYFLLRHLRIGSISRGIALCGTIRAGGTLAFTLGAALDFTLVAAVSALYPAATVTLARFLDHQRLTRVQLAGAALSITALVTLTAALAR